MKLFPAGKLFRPALDVAIVAPILLLKGVPARMPDVTIKVECNGGYGVLDIMRPESGPPGEVFVIFEELRCAFFSSDGCMLLLSWMARVGSWCMRLYQSGGRASMPGPADVFNWEAGGCRTWSCYHEARQTCLHSTEMLQLL